MTRFPHHHMQPKKLNSFLGRLARDTRGNMLAIAAASAIPLLGMLGAGVDVSRAYLVKSRLQQACDAGVLAGRKVMLSTVDSRVRSEVQKFVNFDFPQGYLGSSPFTINPVEGQERTVELRLSTVVPAEIVKIVGFESFPVKVECTAREDFVNTDIMLVLDTTLSMNCLPSEGAFTYCPSEKSGSKISALRQGVTELYRSLRDPQTRLEASGLRLRYGVVPYSMTANTGKLLYDTSKNWIRNPASYQVCIPSGKNACASVTTQNVNHSNAWFTSAWQGCIEERSTITSITAASGYTIPAGATDLDIDRAPTSDATRWAPYDPAVVTAKSGYPGISDACPRASRHLAPFASETEVTQWLSSMSAGGFTYHDIGLIWGARLMSSTGLWGSQNANTFNTFPVHKHMIFMTDGVLDPDLNAYSAYGVETHAEGGRRVTGDGNESRQTESHLQRFRMMCNKIKGDNISLWVIAFGTSAGTGLSDELKNCASSSSHAFSAADQAALNARFRQIGESIGALRLSK